MIILTIDSPYNTKYYLVIYYDLFFSFSSILKFIKGSRWTQGLLRRLIRSGYVSSLMNFWQKFIFTKLCCWTKKKYSYIFFGRKSVDDILPNKFFNDESAASLINCWHFVTEIDFGDYISSISSIFPLVDSKYSFGKMYLFHVEKQTRPKN